MLKKYPFTREQRLLSGLEYKYVFERACKSTDRYLTVLARPNTQTIARLGLAIAKKRVKLAVARNRIKRLTRESFRLHQSDLVGLDCVVLARNGVEQANNHTLLHSLSTHWLSLSRRCKKY